MNAPTANLDHLADLASRYARYSRSAGGLSSVFGGVLLVLVFAANAWVELSATQRLWLAAAPVSWLLVKELLRRAYYQRDGLALQKPSPQHRRWHRWGVIYLAVMAVLINAGFLLAAARAEALDTTQVAGYVMMVSALPFVAWRWMWSVSDFLVGVLLLCQAAVVLGGGHYPSVWMLYVGAVALLVIGIGVREHHDYLRLRGELAALRT